MPEQDHLYIGTHGSCPIKKVQQGVGRSTLLHVEEHFCQAAPNDPIRESALTSKNRNGLARCGDCIMRAEDARYSSLGQRPRMR